MDIPRYKSKLFVLMVVALVLAVLFTTIPPFSVLLPGLTPYFWPLMAIGLASFMVYLVATGIALKRIGRSPLWVLTGFLFGPTPLILFLALPNLSDRA